MSIDVVLGWEDTAWPVLLLESSGIIRRANRPALAAFGPDLQSGTQPLTRICPSGGELTTWFARPDKGNGTQMALKLTLEGRSQSFLAAINPVTVETRHLFLLQLFAQAAEADPKSVTTESMAQKQKLECALQMARTVALDFNNALTSILGYTSLILGKLEPDSPWRSALLGVEKSASRAAAISHDLATFSRMEKDTKAQASGSLNALLQRCLNSFQATPGDKEINWVTQYERRLYSAKFDEGKMYQAMAKILDNALESIATRGRISIQTKNMDLTQPTQDRSAQLAAGAYVCVEITDNGVGMDEAVLQRVFEPFFTTKRGEKHRGLGLAWVYGVVTNHGGGVALSSQPGVGTSVRVYLPADKTIIKDQEVSPTDLTGTQSILMVDDEDMVLAMGQDVLTTYGYKVMTALGGQRALELLSKSDDHVELLITDLVMPGMSGRELIQKVRELSPDTRILCSSGYVQAKAQSMGPDVHYLQKPFTANELLLKVKQVLSTPEGSSVD